VDNVCVIASPTPTPTPGTTPTPSECNELLCIFSGGTCVNGVCVPNSPTPTPTSTPTPTPTPTSNPLKFTAKQLDQMTIEPKTCQNVDLTTMNVVLNADTIPDGNVCFYSAIFVTADQSAAFFFAQKDILNNDVFILLDSNTIKAQTQCPFPEDGSWEDTAFMNFFKKDLAGMGVTCQSLVDSGICFLLGYAPGGDFSQFKGAAFTFVSTP
jgi:hypothetical protein